MRFIILLIALFVSCNKDTSSPQIDLETMVDIHKETFGYKSGDNYFVNFWSDDKNVVIPIENVESDYSNIGFLKSFYIANFNDVRVIVRVKDFDYLRETVPNDLHFVLMENPNYKNDWKPYISDYPQLDFYYNRTSKRLDKIGDRGIDFKIRIMEHYPYYELKRDD